MKRAPGSSTASSSGMTLVAASTSSTRCQRVLRPGQYSRHRGRDTLTQLERQRHPIARLLRVSPRHPYNHLPDVHDPRRRPAVSGTSCPPPAQRRARSSGTPDRSLLRTLRQSCGSHRGSGQLHRHQAAAKRVTRLSVRDCPHEKVTDEPVEGPDLHYHGTLGH